MKERELNKKFMINSINVFNFFSKIFFKNIILYIKLIIIIISKNYLFVFLINCSVFIFTVKIIFIELKF